MGINISSAARAVYEECERIRAITTNQRNPSGQVYLIYRFDDDDSTLGVMWDSKYSSGQDTTALSWSDSNGGTHTHPRFDFVEKRESKSRVFGVFLDKNNKPLRGKAANIKRSYEEPAEMQGGGHAEEFFLRHLLAVMKESQLGHAFIPKKIDLYISRVPCANTSPAWLVNFNGQSIRLPLGCGPKLFVAARYLSFIDWNIFYGQDYSPGVHRTSSRESIARLNRLPNVNAGRMF